MFYTLSEHLVLFLELADFLDNDACILLKICQAQEVCRHCCRPHRRHNSILGLRDWNKGISEQELGPMDPKDSKATPHSDTRGDERGLLGVNSQLHRASLHNFFTRKPAQYFAA